jgi:hypothetical protein
MTNAVKILIAGSLACLCLACGPDPRQQAANDAPTPAPTVDVGKKKTFEDDLAFVRESNFLFVFVLRRKDGGNWAGSDTAFLRANSPLQTNQRLLSDDGKAVILGTNFRFYPGQWDALHKEFDFQDMSEAKYERSEIDDISKEDPHGPKKKITKE